MWLIQWAAEHGLDWLISDKTFLGVMALHPTQLIVFTLVILIAGIYLGMFIERARSGKPRQPRRIPIISSIREKKFIAQSEARRNSENLENWHRHLMRIDVSEKAFLKVLADEGEAFGFDTDWDIPFEWIDSNLNTLTYFERIEGGLVRFTPTEQLKGLRNRFSDTFNRVSGEVVIRARNRKDGPPSHVYTSRNRFPQWWWYTK